MVAASGLERARLKAMSVVETALPIRWVSVSVAEIAGMAPWAPAVAERYWSAPRV